MLVKPFNRRLAVLAAGLLAVSTSSSGGSTAPEARAASVRSLDLSSIEESAAERRGRTPRLTRAAFQDPPASVRPGTRWWWDQLLNPTAEFDLETALAEVDAMAAAGLGRLEIAWAAASYGTQEQRDALAAVVDRAREHGMQVDMTLGASWPWHTPETQGEGGQQELTYGRADLTGPTTLSGEVPAPIGGATEGATLVAVTAARVVTAGPPVTSAGTAPESSTVLKPGSFVDLSAKVEDGTITWKVPSGDWVLVSVWRRPSATCGVYTTMDGPCVSLIDQRSVRKATGYVDEAQLGTAGRRLPGTGHSFFEDSLEYDADMLYWSADFLREFERRRGYDVTTHLPLLFVQGFSGHGTPSTEPTPDFDLPRGEGARYRHDFYETLTDLYADEHLAEVGQWARRYGMQFRAQPAYGNPFDVTRSAREAASAGVLSDHESLTAGDAGSAAPGSLNSGPQPYEQPDSVAWRTAMENYRMLTSGSAQGGELEVSSELGAMFYYELGTSLRDFKRMMDKEWAAGVTRPLLHGFTHSPPDTPWPGASHFGGIVGEALNPATWPEWSNLRPLADYWGRGALVLQQGAAKTDVAVLRDSFHGAPTFDPHSAELAGFTTGYVDPRGVAQASQGIRGELFPDGPAYRALVIDASQLYFGSRLPARTVEALDRASAKGLAVVVVGEPPRRGASGRNPVREDRVVRAGMARILARSTTTRIARASDLGAALRRLGLRPASAWSDPVRVYSQRRETADATYYYLWNATGERLSTSASFAGVGSPVWLDLWDGSRSPVAEFRSVRGRTALPLTLAPHGTAVLMIRHDAAATTHVVRTSADRVREVVGSLRLEDADGGRQSYTLSTVRSGSVALPRVEDAPITVGAGPGAWSLQATTYGPEGVVDRPAVPLPGGLSDWREIPGLTTESGIGTYRSSVTVAENWVSRGRGVRLDLGTFHGSIEVSVNDKRVGRDIDPQDSIDVSKWLEPGTNAITIVLATTPFNKALASPSTVATRPVWAASVANGPQPSGLLGPVRLTPYAWAEVARR